MLLLNQLILCSYLKLQLFDIQPFRSLILQYIEGVISLSDEQLVASEVSGDGVVSVMDASLVLRFVTGRVDCFPVETTCTLSVRSR